MPLIERQCNNYRSDAIGYSWQQNSLIAVPDVRWDADELSRQLVTECRGAQPSPSERSFVSKTRQMGKSSHQPYISSFIIEKLPPAGTAALRFSVGRKQGNARPSTERSAQSPEDAVCLGLAHRFFRRETTLRTVRAAGAPAASPSGGAGGSFRHRRIRLTRARAPHLPAAERSLEARSVRKAR